MTTPLDLRGPDFLLFYIPYGLCVFALAWLARVLWSHASDRSIAGARWSPGIYPAEGDAYTLALLRGGPREVAVAVLGRLVAEGFLFLESNALRLPKDQTANRSRLSPLEQEAYAAVASAAGSSGVAPPKALSLVEKRLEPRLAGARADLEAAGLAPDAGQQKGYRAIGLVTGLLVLGLGVAKLLVAWMRGRSNVGFLLLLLFFGTFAVVALRKPPLQTPAGRRYLKWLRESHQGLVSMVSDGRRQGFGELALVAGIFGLETLPALAPLRKALIPPPSSSGDGGSGCGGGGGCGGGCGGCGG